MSLVSCPGHECRFDYVPKLVSSTEFRMQLGPHMELLPDMQIHIPPSFNALQSGPPADASDYLRPASTGAPTFSYKISERIAHFTPAVTYICFCVSTLSTTDMDEHTSSPLCSSSSCWNTNTRPGRASTSAQRSSLQKRVAPPPAVRKLSSDPEVSEGRYSCTV
jgi:hypothetical protein